MTSFADITTLGVGGVIADFEQPATRDELLDVIHRADSQGDRLCVIGGGSNLVVSDDAFAGVVVRDARHGVTVSEIPGSKSVRVYAEAGCSWDDLVAHTVDLGLMGIEGLSGVPGTVGASVVQNIGAYGQEVSTSVESVEVWDRRSGSLRRLNRTDLQFGYRTSMLKQSMLPAGPEGRRAFFPSPRCIVLAVTFILQRSNLGTVAYEQLAHALHVELGRRVPATRIRDAVLRVRARKGMLEDALRYRTPSMAGTKDEARVQAAIEAQRMDDPITDRHSCGSFFVNPMLTPHQVAGLPVDAPRFPAAGDSHAGAVLDHALVKTSAAWLIDHAGFHRGYALTQTSRAGLSSRHTLALVNRAGASAQEVADLAEHIQQGVLRRFGIRLVIEPVVVGFDLH